MIGADGVTGASAGFGRGSVATSSSVVVVMVGTSAAGGVTATGSASLTVAGGIASSLRSVLVKVPQPVSMSPTKSQTMANGERRTSHPPRAHGLIPPITTHYSRSESPPAEKFSGAQGNKVA